MDRMPTTLTDVEKAWFDSAEFATIATIEPDGRPHLSVVWVSRDGGDILVSTVEGRRKHRNLIADPRCTVLLFPKESPYTYVEIRGTATTADDPGCALRDRIRAKHGIGADAPDPAAADRVVIAVEPVRIVTYGH
jgi:PPOX class probable F420-dependent enzyme